MKYFIRLTLITVSTLWVLSYSSFAEAAKMKIAPHDYSQLWKSFAKNDASLDPAMEYPYEDCFRAVAELHNLPLALLLAVARGESDFNPRAQSSKSCYGIMQILWPQTANHLEIYQLKDLYNPCRNIRAGAKYLKELMDRYNGDIHLTLAAYNYGPTRIRKDMHASALPQGASWYSGYIYYHLEQVLAGAKVPGKPMPRVSRPVYNPANKLPVIIFHEPYRAKGFIGYFKEESPELRLDWFKTSLGESYVVLLFKDNKEKERGVAIMKKLGYSVDPEKGFL